MAKRRNIRKTKKERIHGVCFDNSRLKGNFDKIISYLQDIKNRVNKKYAEKYIQVFIEQEEDYEFGFTNYFLVGERYKTDEEQESRLKKVAQNKAYRKRKKGHSNGKEKIQI